MRGKMAVVLKDDFEYRSALTVSLPLEEAQQKLEGGCELLILGSRHGEKFQKECRD